MARAVLYARVSSREQVENGYSLRQQLEALRQYAASNGYEVIEEVTDPGVDGGSLDRPGLIRVRDLVAAGDVSVVLAQDRDRFAREPILTAWLRRQFEDFGTQLRSLQDRGDDSPEGELTDGILDQIARYEKKLIARRTVRGREQRAREGEIIAGGSPPYGFCYSADRTNYEPDEADMAVVRRIFRMVGTEGFSLSGVKKTFEREGLPTPKNGKYWNRPVLRDMILNDLYRPHSYAELETLADEGLLSRDVLGRLNRDKQYGVWWYNRKRARDTSKRNPNGTKKRMLGSKDRKDWIAVPVPDAGIPREWVDRARAAIQDNVRPSNAGRRFWEQSGGVGYCACGHRLSVYTNLPKRDRAVTQFYYVCSHRRRHGSGACDQAKFHRAEDLEDRVRRFVLDLIRNPDVLWEQVQAEAERQKAALRDPEREIQGWLQQLDQANQERDRYNRLFAKGRISEDEYDAYMVELDQRKATAEHELSQLKDARQRIKELDALPELVEDYLRDLPQQIDYPARRWDQDDTNGDENGLRIYKVTPDTAKARPEIDRDAMGRKYRGLYDDLKLKVKAFKYGTLELSWVGGKRRLHSESDQWESLDAVPDPG